MYADLFLHSQACTQVTGDPPQSASSQYYAVGTSSNVECTAASGDKSAWDVEVCFLSANFCAFSVYLQPYVNISKTEMVSVSCRGPEHERCNEKPRFGGRLAKVFYTHTTEFEQVTITDLASVLILYALNEASQLERT